jgi:hypothetical protein
MIRSFSLLAQRKRTKVPPLELDRKEATGPENLKKAPPIHTLQECKEKKGRPCHWSACGGFPARPRSCREFANSFSAATPVLGNVPMGLFTPAPYRIPPAEPRHTLFRPDMPRADLMSGQHLPSIAAQPWPTSRDVVYAGASLPTILSLKIGTNRRKRTTGGVS